MPAFMKCPSRTTGVLTRGKKISWHDGYKALYDLIPLPFQRLGQPIWLSVDYRAKDYLPARRCMVRPKIFLASGYFS